MTAQNDLDLSGDLKTNPFAELLVEIGPAKLSGSFRFSRGEQKTIAYVDDGGVTFAVSNARKFRLFDILLRENRISKDALGKFPNFANDIEFANALKENGVLKEEEIKQLFDDQVSGILSEVMGWTDGEWSFSPLARIRGGVRANVDVADILIRYVQGLSAEAVAFRFKSMHEKFSIAYGAQPDANIDPRDAFVLSRLTVEPMPIADLRFLSGISENDLMISLYRLWFAGLVVRYEWSPAFTDFRIAKIRTANLKLAKAATDIKKPQPPPQAQQKPVETPKAEEAKVEFKEISLDEYLARVENAESHYEVLGLEQNAQIPEVRNSYFELAKMFHPDRFHRAEAAVLRRVENAFSKLAQAHEALRDPRTRTAYDNQLRREMADKKLKGDQPMDVKVQGNQLNAERAEQEFEHGRQLLGNGDYEEALPYLARAAHLDPQAARYHAFYGKALSFTDNGRHKAESEMQSAIRIEPNNVTYRLMLAEFFINVKLIKRAEGELTRLLAITPDNREARDLLESLKQK